MCYVVIDSMVYEVIVNTDRYNIDLNESRHSLFFLIFRLIWQWVVK